MLSETIGKLTLFIIMFVFIIMSSYWYLYVYLFLLMLSIDPNLFMSCFYGIINPDLRDIF